MKHAHVKVSGEEPYQALRGVRAQAVQGGRRCFEGKMNSLCEEPWWASVRMCWGPMAGTPELGFDLEAVGAEMVLEAKVVVRLLSEG